MTYRLSVAYQEDSKKRLLLNQLMAHTFAFSFEPWYQTGQWPAAYKSYSLFDGDRILANTGAYEMHLQVARTRFTAIQLGAVTAIEEVRGQHLASTTFLAALEAYPKADMFFLYAEQTAVGFYPRFGFKEIPAYFLEKEIHKSPYFHFEKADYEKDYALLERLMKYGQSASRIHMEDPLPLRMFCLPFYKDQYYLCKEGGILAVAERVNGQWTFSDILSFNPVDPDQVAASLIDQNNEKVIFRFNPIDGHGTLVRDPDHLFVKYNRPIKHGNFLIPPLMRT